MQALTQTSTSTRLVSPFLLSPSLFVYTCISILPVFATQNGFPFSLGSGRVTFNNQRSYLKAVSAAFVEIKTPKFTKKVSAFLSQMHAVKK